MLGRKQNQLNCRRGESHRGAVCRQRSRETLCSRAYSLPITSIASSSAYNSHAKAHSPHLSPKSSLRHRLACPHSHEMLCPSVAIVLCADPCLLSVLFKPYRCYCATFSYHDTLRITYASRIFPGHAWLDYYCAVSWMVADVSSAPRASIGSRATEFVGKDCNASKHLSRRCGCLTQIGGRRGVEHYLLRAGGRTCSIVVLK